MRVFNYVVTGHVPFRTTLENKGIVKPKVVHGPAGPQLRVSPHDGNPRTFGIFKFSRGLQQNQNGQPVAGTNNAAQVAGQDGNQNEVAIAHANVDAPIPPQKHPQGNLQKHGGLQEFIDGVGRDSPIAGQSASTVKMDDAESRTNQVAQALYESMNKKLKNESRDELTGPQKAVIHEFVRVKQLTPNDIFLHEAWRSLRSGDKTFTAAESLLKANVPGVNIVSDNARFNHLHFLIDGASKRPVSYASTDPVAPANLKDHFKRLIVAGVDPGHQSSSDKRSENALHMAARTGCAAFLEACAEIMESADTSAPTRKAKDRIEAAALQFDKAGKTPAHYVKTVKHAELMLTCGTDVNRFQMRTGPVICFAESREMISVWRKAGAETDIRKMSYYDPGSGKWRDCGMETSFIANGFVQTAQAVKFFCDEAGHDPTKVNGFRSSSLHEAPNAQVAQALVDEIRARYGQEKLDSMFTFANRIGVPLVTAKNNDILKVYLDAGAVVTDLTIKKYREEYRGKNEKIPHFREGLQLLQHHKNLSTDELINTLNDERAVSSNQEKAIIDFYDRAQVEMGGLRIRSAAEFMEFVEKTLIGSSGFKIDYVSALVKTGFIDPNRQPDNSGNTCLHMLLLQEPPLPAEKLKERVQTLFDLGADPSIRNKDGKNPMHLAVEKKEIDAFIQVCSERLQNGTPEEKARIKKAANQVDNAGKMPAADAKTVKAAQFMLDCGVNVNKFDYMSSPMVLPLICWIQTEEVGKFWIKNGAKTSMEELTGLPSHGFISYGWAQTKAAVDLLCGEHVGEDPTSMGLNGERGLHLPRNEEVAGAIIDAIKSRPNGKEELEEVFESANGKGYRPIEYVSDFGVIQTYVNAGARVTEDTVKKFKAAHEGRQVPYFDDIVTYLKQVAARQKSWDA